MKGARTRTRALDACASILKQTARPMSSTELIGAMISKNPRSTRWAPQAQALSIWLRGDQRFKHFGRNQWKLK